MKLFSRSDLSKYFAEMVVVVLGILIALQVDEWRQRLVEQQEIDAALVRLADEVEENLRFCELVEPYSLLLVRASQVVLASLQSGRLRETDRSKFEEGLVKISWLSFPPYFSTVAEEMISTGLLKELDRAELRSNIARIPGSVAATDNRFSRQIEIADWARLEIRNQVGFRYDGSIDESLARKVESSSDSTFVDSISVNYEFDALAANPFLINLIIDATNNQIENFAANQRLCQLFENVDMQLAQRGSF
jgi:hypothetical protein